MELVLVSQTGATPTKIPVGGVSAKVQFPELMHAGVYQINAVIPSGYQPLRAAVGGIVVRGNVYVTVQEWRAADIQTPKGGFTPY